MPCPDCESYTNANGHCFTPHCSNKQPEQQAPKRKPKQALRKQSAKKRKEIRDTKDIREVLPGERCESCNQARSVATHEVVGGAHRHRAVHDRRAQIRLCNGPGSCHEHFQSLPYVDQIVLKVEAMIDGINACHGSIAVTADDVKDAL